MQPLISDVERGEGWCKVSYRLYG